MNIKKSANSSINSPTRKDRNFYHREPITYLEEQLTVQVIVFTQPPLSICVERDNHREYVLGIAVATAVFDMVSRVEYGITIDTSDQTLTQTVAEVVGHLPVIP